MQKCWNCLCHSYINACYCRGCTAQVTTCMRYVRYEQLSIFADQPLRRRRRRQKQNLPRFYSWDDYGISKDRYRELRDGCRNGLYKDMMADAASRAAPLIAEYILLSVTKGRTYEGVEHDDKLGRIPCGRTDFYGYRRLFYHYLDMALKDQKV